jgi:predicted ArsR family transcriptional regulator
MMIPNNIMSAENLTDDLLAVLHLLNEKGPTVCTGACELRLPGELHCLNAGQMLNISAQGFKNRLKKLVLMGLLDRHRVVREDGKAMGQYTVSKEGLKAINQIP